MKKNNDGFIFLSVLLVAIALFAGGTIYTLSKKTVPKIEIPLQSTTSPVLIENATTSPAEVEITKGGKKETIKTIATTTIKIIYSEPTPPTTSPLTSVRTYTQDDIVKEWSPRIVIVQCYTPTASYHGAGLAYTAKNGDLMVITAKHILFPNEQQITTQYCSVIFPDSLTTLYRIDSFNRFVDPKFDIAYLKLGDVSSSVKTLLVGKNLNICKTSDISVSQTTGEPTVVFGYPDYIKTYLQSEVVAYRSDSFGDNYGNYAITPGAGVGYSGAPVISVQDNCNLGIEDSGDATKAYVIDLNRVPTTYN